MKKAITLLMIITYLFISNIYIQIFASNELSNMYNNEMSSVIINDWSKDTLVEDKLIEISEISKASGINIYKLVYTQSENLNKITVYSSIVNEIGARDIFNIKSDDLISNLISENKYLSSINTKDKLQSGEINIFNDSVVIEIKDLKTAINENIRGEYLIQTKNYDEIKDISNKLEYDLGFEIYKPSENHGAELIDIGDLGTIIAGKTKAVFSILIISIILSFLYYMILRYKELAVKKMFGYSEKRLIYKDLLGDSLIIHIISILISNLLVYAYLCFYKNASNIYAFFEQLIRLQLLFTLCALVFERIIFSCISNIKISYMLKNKKPIAMMQLLNYTAKFIFSMILVTACCSLLNNYINLKSANKNIDMWKTTQQYSFLEVKPITPETNTVIWGRETGIKSRKLFSKLNSSGAILVNPSNYISFKELISSEEINKSKGYDPINGEVIMVNSEYLDMNPVYDIQGEQVSIPKEYGDFLIILVPEKYSKDEKQLLETYENWYQFSRFIDEDMYNDYVGIDIKDHPKVKVEIVYIKDGQEHFLYDPTLEVENNNFIKDSVLMIINSENMGDDYYLNYISAGTFYPKVRSTDTAYNDIYDALISSELDDQILSAPILYSRVDRYLYNLQNSIFANLIVSIMLIVLELIITLFMIINYSHRNKQINTIKKLNGYSYIKRHLSFIVLFFAMWGLIYLIGNFLNMFNLENNILLILLIIFLESTVIYFSILKLEKQKILNVIKGE